MNHHFRPEFRKFSLLVGQKEPFIAGGTYRGENRAHTRFESSDLDEDRGHISYRYPGALGLALFIDGNVEQISISYGTSIDVDVLDRDNFK